MTPEPETTASPRAEPGPRILVLFGSVALFGAERGNIEALSALKACGAEILCLVSDEHWNTAVPPALWVRGFTCRRVSYVHIGWGLNWYNVLFGNFSRFVRANFAFWRVVREFNPTHIHAYAQSFVANFLIGLMLVRTPLVFRAGDEPTFHNIFWRLTWRYVVRRTTRFVANSRFVEASLVKHSVKVDRISLIYNAPPSRSDQLTATKSPAGAAWPQIVYVGQMAERKGPHLLIESFKSVAPEFPNARLALAGRIDDIWEGDAWARALRDRTLADDALRDRVRFLGNVEDVQALYAASSFVVVPSLFDDPAPNVVMEAKQARRAIVGFPRGGIPELIEHNVDGLVCAEASVLALASALRQYLNDPDLARRHGEAARLSMERLEVQQFGRKWRAVYRAAAARPDGGSATVRSNIEEARG